MDNCVLSFLKFLSDPTQPFQAGMDSEVILNFFSLFASLKQFRENIPLSYDQRSKQKWFKGNKNSQK
jgi:hypothetical protein